MSGPLALNWNLERCLEDIWHIAKTFVTAAEHDDVQMKAIVCCQGFGNTIAMCPETIKNVERRILVDSKPSRVKFLTAYVGFSQSDTAALLANNQAGLRFLSLAASIIPSMGLRVAAEVLHAMLEGSTTDQLNVPAPRHLKKLLMALEPRCISSGFSDLELKWHFQLSRLPGESADPNLAGAFPKSDGLKKLIEAFREIYRVGESTVKKIKIWSRGCTAWIAAFTEWCLGVPPRVLSHDGQRLFGPDGSYVCIIHHPSDPHDSATSPPFKFSMTLEYTIDGPRTLVDTQDINTSWRGMPSIERYGQWLLHSNGLNKDNNYRALDQILPFAIYQVMDLLAFSHYHPFSHEAGVEAWLPQGEFLQHSRYYPVSTPGYTAKNMRLVPFAKPDDIAYMLQRLTGIKSGLKRLPDGLLISDFPYVKEHLQVLKSTCRCAACMGLQDSDESDAWFKPCEHQNFKRSISNVVADILALSLFIFPDELHIRIPFRYHQMQSTHDFAGSVQSIIWYGHEQVTNYRSLLDWALVLVGHDVKRELNANEWVASSSMGQAVWPAIFETQLLGQSSCLNLQWCRGQFQYQKETYCLVKDFADMDTIIERANILPNPAPVTKMGNQFESLAVEWRVQVDETLLRVSLGLSDSPRALAFTTVSPCRALANLITSLVVENCQHDPKSELNSPDSFAVYAHPMDPLIEVNECRDDALGLIGVVAVSGQDNLRFASLACGNMYAPVVIRGSACLSCCLGVCRKSTYPVLIL